MSNWLTQTIDSKTRIGNISLVKNSFETGKDYYTCKISCSNANGSDTYIYRVVSPNGNLPSFVLGGSANASKPWGCPFGGSRYSMTCYVASATNMNTGIGGFGITLQSHIGNNIFSSYRLIGDGVVSDGGIDNDTIDISIDADFPIFMGAPERVGTDPNYIEYRPAQNNNLLTYTTEISSQNNLQHINMAVNFLNVVDSIPADQVYTIRTHLKKNGSVVGGSSKAYDFKIQPDAKIWIVWTDRLTGDDSPNFILHLNKSPWLQKNSYAPDSAYTETSSLDTDYWRGSWQDYDTGDSYVGWSSTNIPIFTSEEKGEAYGRGEIGIDEALNGGDTSFYISTIGDDLSSSEIPTVNLSTSGVGCYIYALSSSQLKEIMSNYLYTDDATLKAAYVDALWMWGNNPIDFMIDLYYIPFSISNFYDTNNANLKFGTYQIPDTSYPVVIESNGDRITLFETSFEPIYNDWRDYTQFDYDLFLPYVGWVSLDPQKYINKMVRCEMMFDITTHNLRYYLFADDIITDRVDGSVGINLPLMATDQVNKAKNDRAADRKMVGLAAQTAGGIISGAANLMVGNVAGAVSNIAGSAINDITGAMEIYDMKSQKAKQSVEGSFSSAMNIYDIKYAYLRITEKPLLLPDKLHDLYGYPCYYMGKASALSGYCEISDIRLNGFTGTKEEAEALKITLREGVIL